MTTATTRTATMTNTRTNTMNGAAMTSTIQRILPAGLLGLLIVAGCGPTFDPASLVEGTRVVGARVEVDGAPERASPQPGDTANVTWLVTAPGATPPLGWTFAVCPAGTGDAACLAAPLARFDGAGTPPRLSLAVPSAAQLGGATSLTLYGAICAGDDALPQFDAQTALATCPAGGKGTTVTFALALQMGDDVNHNPTADRGFTLDGVSWPVAAVDGDPCTQGPRVSAGSKGHLLGQVTQGSDREAYTAVMGAPPVATPTRERLQLSRFTTAGKLKSQFSFVEATDDSASTAVAVTWDAPEAADVPAAGAAVTFTFVVRDDRGGTDWTTRTLCVAP